MKFYDCYSIRILNCERNREDKARRIYKVVLNVQDFVVLQSDKLTIFKEKNSFLTNYKNISDITERLNITPE